MGARDVNTDSADHADPSPPFGSFRCFFSSLLELLWRFRPRAETFSRQTGRLITGSSANAWRDVARWRSESSRR